MTISPSGMRQTLRAWRRRILALIGTWVALVLMTAALGLRPSILHFAVILLAGAMIVWYAVDHGAANQLRRWPLTDIVGPMPRRGGDYRVTSLAGRLLAADLRGEGRPELTRQLHGHLSMIIRERLFAKHGITIEEEPRWAEGVMPPELWDFVTGLPDPALYSPTHLDQILRRIEQW